MGKKLYISNCIWLAVVLLFLLISGGKDYNALIVIIAGIILALFSLRKGGWIAWAFLALYIALLIFAEILK